MSALFDMRFFLENTISLDVEFSEPEQPELLSLALVSGRGHEHYAEVDPKDPECVSVLSRCSEFVYHGGVLSQWGIVPCCASSYAAMAQGASDWLFKEASSIHARTGQRALITFDYLTDYNLLKKLLADFDHWGKLESLIAPLNVKDLTDTFEAAIASEAALESMGRRGLGRHHALADAHALRAALHAALTGRRLRL